MSGVVSPVLVHQAEQYDGRSARAGAALIVHQARGHEGSESYLNQNFGFQMRGDNLHTGTVSEALAQQTPRNRQRIVHAVYGLR